MNRRGVHEIVEFIRSQAEFPCDAADIDAVLAYFRIDPVQGEEDLNTIRAGLIRLGLAVELAEVERLVHAELAG